MAGAAAVGALLGPALAGWSMRLVGAAHGVGAAEGAGAAGGGPPRPPRWWRGTGASHRRRWLVTLATAVAWGVTAGGVAQPAALPAYLWFATAAVLLTVVDIDHHLLPNRLTYPTYLAGLLLLGIASLVGGSAQPYLRAVVAMVALFGATLVVAVAAPAALGLGDVKLAGLLGLYLGWLGTGYLLLGIGFGVAAGAVLALLLLVTGRAGLGSEVAYGPPLLLGAMVSVGFGSPLLGAYLGLAGL